MPPSAIAGTPARPARRGGLQHGSELRHTDAGHDARGADADPGPMPIFTASAPASISASAPSGVATLPRSTCTAFDSLLIAATASSTPAEWPCARVDDDHVHLGLDQCRAPGIARRPRPRWPPRRAAAQLVLVGQRVCLRLVHVLDGDQPDAAIGIVHHQQLFDAVAVQQAAGLLWAHASATVTRFSRVINS